MKGKTMERCEPTAHDFEKFNESTVVCRRCAEQRTVTTLEAVMEQLRSIHLCPTYIPCTLPHYPSWQQPQYPYWYYSTTGGTVSSGGATTYSIQTVE